MKKMNFEHSDVVLFRFLDKFLVHFSYWVIIALLFHLLS